MSNMSYCRFRNTLEDLRDCYEGLDDELDDGLHSEELIARKRLIALCQKIIDKAEDVGLIPDRD